MKVKVTRERPIKYEGEEYEEGDEFDMDDAKAEKAIEKGIVDRVEEESEEKPEPEELDIEPVGASEEQLTKMQTLKDRLGLDNSDLNEMAREEAGVDALDKLSKDEANEIIDDLTTRMTKKEKAAEEVHSFPSGEAGQKAAQKMLQKDKEQIMDEITGKVSRATVEKWFYQFKQGGETVTGITYDGVMAVFRKQGNIDVIVEDIWKEHDEEKDQDFVFVKVRALDKARNSSIERVSKEPTSRRFAMRIAQSTAQKKAVRALVDDEFVTDMYAKWKEEAEEDEGW
jgi:hypothetical protein